MLQIWPPSEETFLKREFVLKLFISFECFFIKVDNSPPPHSSFTSPSLGNLDVMFNYSYSLYFFTSL